MRYEVYGNQGVLIDDLVEIAKTNGMTVVAEERACCLVVDSEVDWREMERVFYGKSDLVGMRHDGERKAIFPCEICGVNMDLSKPPHNWIGRKKVCSSCYENYLKSRQVAP